MMERRVTKLIGLLLYSLFVSAHALAQTDHSFFFIEPFTWQMREGGADCWAQEIAPAGSSQPIRIMDAPFQWNRGVRLGVGHVFAQSGHDIVLAYTTYHTLATSEASGRVASSFDANYFANNTNGASLDIPYRSASIRWHFYYDTLDLSAGHRFELDKSLQLRPYVGLKGASLKQRIFSNWHHPIGASNFTNATENLRNDFVGLGPSIGIDTTWPLFASNNQSIHLLGQFTGALMYGHWNFEDVYQNDAPVNITVTVNSINGAAPMAGGLLGLQWAKQFAHAELSLSAGYEVQMWFNQVQYYSLNGGRLNRSTALQGVDLEIKYSV